MAVPLWAGGLGVGAKEFFGSPSENRDRELKMLELLLADKRHKETLAAQEKQYEMVPWKNPVTGETIYVPRNAVGSVIAAGLTAEGQRMDPTELGALGTLRERLVNPKAASLAGAEAAAERAKWGQTSMPAPADTSSGITSVPPDVIRNIARPEAISGLNVDMSPGVQLPLQGVKTVFDEAKETAKTRGVEEGKARQGAANARYNELYNVFRRGGEPHEIATVHAMEGAFKEFGVYPEHQTFMKEPAERAPQWPSLEGRASAILARPEATWSDEDRRIVTEYRQRREPQNKTLLNYFEDLQSPDPNVRARAQQIIRDYRRTDPQEQMHIAQIGNAIMAQARSDVMASLSQIDRIQKTPQEIDAMVGEHARRRADALGAEPIIDYVYKSTGVLPPPLAQPRQPVNTGAVPPPMVPTSPKAQAARPPVPAAIQRPTVPPAAAPSAGAQPQQSGLPQTEAERQLRLTRRNSVVREKYGTRTWVSLTPEEKQDVANTMAARGW